MDKETVEKILADQGNTLFGIPFPQIRRIISEYQTKGIDPLEMAKLRANVLILRTVLSNLRQNHNYCEDTFYCCPKQEDYCGNDDSGECDCGADAANALIDATLEETK